MPKRSDEHMAQRREQIIDAAMRAFARKGFHQSSMKDICEEANLSVGAVYVHFKAKRDIIHEMMRINQEFLQKIRIESLDKFEQLMLDNITAQVRDHDGTGPRLQAQLVTESLSDPDIHTYLKTALVHSENFLRDTITHLKSTGDIRPDYDADLGARILVLIIQGTMQNALVLGEDGIAGCKACMAREFVLMRNPASEKSTHS